MASLNKTQIIPSKDDLVFQIIDFHTENYDKRENQDDEHKSYDDDNSDDEQDECEFTYDSDDDRYVRVPINQSADEEEELADKTAKYTIYLFGKDKVDNTYCVEITDFTPYMYIRVPDYCNDTHRMLIEEWIKKQLKSSFRDGLLRTSLLDKYSFRNFELDNKNNKKKYKFMRIVFNNTTSLRATVNLFQNRKYDSIQKKYIITPRPLQIFGVTDKNFVYDLYENMIDPLLKFIHHRHIKPVGWAKIKKDKWSFREHTLSHCNYDLSVRWTDIEPIEDVNNSRIKIMAYDIECDSSHGDFPIPKKDYTKLAREIYSWYLKNQKMLVESAKATTDERDTNLEYAYYNQLIKKKDKFIKWCINKSFHHYKVKDNMGYIDELDDLEVHDSDKNEISPIYIKPNKMDTKTKRLKPHPPDNKIIDNVAKKIADKLVIGSMTDTELTEIKKNQSKIISIINKILNENLPPVEGDKTIQVGISFMYYGSTEPYKNYMITVGGCDNLNNADTICCKDEIQLLLKFRDIIIKEDPEIITGYNIDGFDTAWLFKRADELGIIDSFAKIGRLIDFQSVLKERQVKSATGELVKREYVEMPGRIQMDIMPLVQKSYNLESYKLDDVSAEFMNGNIQSLDYDEKQDITLIKSNSIKGLRNNNYVMFNEIDGYLEQKYLDGKKFEVFNLDRKNKTFNVSGKITLNLTKNKCLWCLGKDDTSPADIFRLQKGSDNDRYIIAKYCMMDVILCMELVNKLELITNNIGMANVCMNPLSWIIHRGQGVKILSLVAYFIRDRNYLLPFLYKDSFDRDGYEGAVVLDPMPNIYLEEPISVLDYGSLYPSSMIERNLSHETIINNPKYLGDAGGRLLNQCGYDYEDVSYDILKTTFTSTGTPKDKEKCGIRTVRFVQYRDGSKGIIPQILQYLIKARKTTRNKIAYRNVVFEDGETLVGIYDEKKGLIINENGKIDIKNRNILRVEETYNEFQQKVLDGLQLAFKITANSLYGQIGAKTSDLYYKEIAASTTATGRERLLIAKEYVEEPSNYPHKLKDGHVVFLKNTIVYGDSCTGDTPIILNKNGEIVLQTFMDFDNKLWSSYTQFKSDDTQLTDKHQINYENDNIKIWTHKGWSKIKRIIRHHTYKKIYRILTHNGCVDVTEDHSLLDKNCNQVKPNECIIGMELLHSFPKNLPNIYNDIDNQYSKLNLQKLYVNLRMDNLICDIKERTDGTLYLNNIRNIDKELLDDKIISIRLLHERYNDYVYDIETEEGVFHAGIGSMIIKNTDSVFVQFQCLDEEGRKLSGRAAREKSIKLAIETEHAIQEKKLRDPQVLEYEKTFHPFILFSKKRYVGDLYEFDPDKYSRKSMGIVLKRRDNAPIVKIIYGGIIDIIMKEKNIPDAVISFERNMQKLLRGDYPIDTLIISKTLSSYYKDPTRIAHRVLADRIGERDPGNKPMIGDRIPFVYIKVDKNVKLQGDKIEHPDYVRENSLQLDYEFYIMKQITKPVTQIFALCLDKIPGYNDDITKFDKIFDDMVHSNLWSRNECIKRVNEMKRKEAEIILLTSIRDALGLKKQRVQDNMKYVERATKRKATKDAKNSN
jgi:DNA polymerase elongation subunit (family B)